MSTSTEETNVSARVALTVLTAWTLYAMQFVSSDRTVPLLALLAGVLAFATVMQRSAHGMSSTLLAALLLGWNASVKTVPWPFPLLVPVVVMLVCVALMPAMRNEHGVQWGTRTRAGIGLMALSVLVQCVSLVVAMRAQHEAIVWDVTLFAAGVQLIGVVCEEIVFRGVLLSSLRRATQSSVLAVVLQAVVSAMAHRYGTPGGRAGMLAAGADALALGACAIATQGIGWVLVARVTGTVLVMTTLPRLM